MDNEDIKEVILGTGSYEKVLSGNTVSITGDGGNAWGYCGNAYKKLAPRLATYLPYAEGYENLSEIHDEEEYLRYRKTIEDEYIRSFYETRLKNLDVYELIQILYEKFGKNIILLCHEPWWEFCHRRLLADYIELLTGIYIPEVSVDQAGKVMKINPLRYKNRLKKFIENK